MLASKVAGIRRAHPVRVAIDGVDAAGKTTLADELGNAIEKLGRPVIRSSVDGFHNPQNVRYSLGRHSPEGYFLHSFNYSDFTELLLAPLGPEGSRRYRRSAFDYRTDSPTQAELENAPADAILVCDGIFLLRHELRDHWDLAIFLDVSFEVACSRMAQRNGSSADINDPSNRRYIEGQKRYLRTCSPQANATIVINNENLSAPGLVRF
jgi:uridine kinase